MLHPVAATAQAWLTRVIEQTSMNDGGKPAADDVAAVAVRRSE